MLKMLTYKINGVMVPSLTVKFSANIIITINNPDTAIRMIRKRYIFEQC